MALAVQQDETLFALRGLSPRRVAFWNHHFAELIALAESPGSAASLREYLRREWVHLEDKHRSIVCLCGPTDDEPLRPRQQGASGAYGPGTTFASDLRVTLVQAANRLPFLWHATSRVYDQQQRAGEWEYVKRFDLWRRDPRRDPATDALPEPNAKDDYVDGLCQRMMAEFTGWRPQRALDATA